MATATKTENAVERAQRRVQEALDVEVSYFEVHRNTAAELAQARRNHGDRLLTGELTVEAAGRRVAELQGTVEAAAAAIEAARRQRRQAIADLNAARGDTQLAEVAELERQAEAIEAKTAPLLAQLREVEGCDFVPRADLELAVWRARSASGPTAGDGITVTVPRSQGLRNQAAATKAKANEQRARRIVDSGGIEAPTLDELVQLLVADPERIGPALHVLREWAERAVEHELAQRAEVARRVPEHAENWRPATGEEPVTIAVIWRGGDLVERECRVTCTWIRPEPVNEFDREQRHLALAADYERRFTRYEVRR